MILRSLSLSFVAVLAVASPGRGDAPEDHWAWKPPIRPKVPVVRGTQPFNPIDAFVRAKLEVVGLTPAPLATREQLLRRVTYDLIGLPPTPGEIDAFVNDTSPVAWEKVIDRLLASPRYGERWARHWLDLARYADTNGYEFDEPRPDAWRYRDYVIRSFNEDKPFNRFVLEQLAGDEAFPGDRESLIATGFNLLGPDMTDASDQPQRRLNTLNDMTDTAALAFLGLTVACARCHDHKFEPIPQTDYYRLQAFFAPAAFRRDLRIETADERQVHQSAAREYQTLTKRIREEIAMLESPHRTRLFEDKLAKLSDEAQTAHRTPADKRTGGQQELVAETERLVAVSAVEIAKAMPMEDRTKLESLQKQIKVFDGKKPAALPVAMGLSNLPGPSPKTHLLERGELSHPAVEVQPGFLKVLGGTSPAAVESGRRLVLANWIASRDNPLTARVIANRLWQHHFGRGIVGTASDFGRRGERPTHPELLDRLSIELLEPSKPTDGRPWALKRMHKLMLMSETYKQSTQSSPAADPDNRLLSHANRQRLEGEVVRDALLATSGRLNSTMGGPAVVLPEAAAAAGGSKSVPVSAEPRDHIRRTVYLFNRRNLRHPFLEAFDLPDSNLSCPRRERSTTAPQALALLNAAEATTAAKALATRLEREANSEAERIELAFRLTLGRLPTGAERERATAFLRESPLSELCRALFNLNEFVYLD